jgi:glutathione-regulated potassium-efflux system ancillary protein KefC
VSASFVVDAMVYLAAAVICVPLAARFGLGSVLGYLIAGCAVGPWGLGFVRDVESILHFAEFGVVLMLFLIGLELDIGRLARLRRPVFGGGSLQLALCGALLAAALAAGGLDWTAAIVAGLALAMSSTAIAVQTMAERNVLGAPVGRAAFAVLLFQDIAAIPLIALVPLLSAEAAKAGHPLIGAAKALAAIVAVIVIGRFLTRPALRLVAKADVREVFTAFALLLVMGIAGLMTLAGLSMALGAFLAGVLLASSEYRHALETDIAPFKGLLLGLFFIAVGMSIDFGLVASRPLELAALTAGLLAIKGAALAAIASRLGVAPRQRWLFAALLAQGGEFAFVVLGVARGARVMAGDWEALLIAAVALSMAATPFLLLAYDATVARSARREADADVIDDDSPPVIIAGFGRVGMIVGRLLFGYGCRATVLDHDPDQIELLRRFGFKVFYGDATRLDLLEAAGAAKAKVLVVAVDDVDASLRIVDLAREHFPRLALVARARNVQHYRMLRDRGVTLVERETFESALRLGRDVLERLGAEPYEARIVADTFRRHNRADLERMIAQPRDEQQAVAAAQQGREELEEMLRLDRARREREQISGWGP